MMSMSVVVLIAIALFARADFDTPAGRAEARAPFVFWIMLLAVWAGLIVVFLAGDLFTLYVALELLSFAAVPLVSLDGRAETLRAALRYLLFALAGSVLYLLGGTLMYGVYGTLDIALLAAQVEPEPAALAAAALMTVGLLAKTALFPLHLWLPPAHAGAPAAASALLSSLVIKGSFFIVIRLWLDAFAGVVTTDAAQLLAALGACRDRLRQCGRVAAGTLEADDCLLDRRADRLPLPDVPAGARLRRRSRRAPRRWPAA